MSVRRLNLTYLAALLMAATVMVHIFAGGPEYHEPYQQLIDDANLRSMAAVLWHMVTIVLGAFSLGLLYLALRRNVALEIMVSGIQLALTGLFLWYGITGLGSVWPMPQWIVFSLIPVLTFLGQRRAA